MRINSQPARDQQRQATALPAPRDSPEPLALESGSSFFTGSAAASAISSSRAASRQVALAIHPSTSPSLSSRRRSCRRSCRRPSPLVSCFHSTYLTPPFLILQLQLPHSPSNILHLFVPLLLVTPVESCILQQLCHYHRRHRITTILSCHLSTNTHITHRQRTRLVLQKSASTAVLATTTLVLLLFPHPHEVPWTSDA